MSENQIQAIKDVFKMTPKLSIELLYSIRHQMEAEIDKKLLELDSNIILKNMDITEKVMYLEYLTESDSEKKEEFKNSISFEELLKKEGLNINDL